MKSDKASGWLRTLPTWLGRIRLEILFLLVFFTFGLIFTVIVPPGWNTDETNHSYRIYQLSVGDMLSEKVTDPVSGLKAYGGLVPTNLVNLFEQTGAQKPGTLGNPLYKIAKNLSSVEPDITHLKDDGKRTSINFSGAALYSPAAYAIYIPVFWFGRLLSIPFFWVIILSRLVGLIITGLTFYFAIRISPIGKWIFFVVGLLPTVVAQAATVGADAPQLIVSVLFIAFILKQVLSREEPNIIDYVVFTFLGALLLLVKFVYVPELILLMALPLIRQSCRSRKQISLIVISVILSLIPGLIWLHLINYIDINSNPQANFAAQKAFIVSHPLTYARTLYNTFFTNMQPSLSNLFGSFVWGSVAIPAIYAYLSSATVFLSLFVKDRREVKPTNIPSRNYNIWRKVLGLTALITAVLIASALYIYSTTLKQTSIVGIQARYFIPLLPIILLIFYGNTVRNPRPVKVGIVIMSCLALVGAVLAVYFRLYQIPALLAA